MDGKDFGKKIEELMKHYEVDLSGDGEYKNIQLPVDLHRHIKTLAAAEGISMISFLSRETGFLVGVKK